MIVHKCQIDGEDFVNFCGLLRKQELYKQWYFVTEIDPTYCEKKCSSDREKKIEIRG